MKMFTFENLAEIVRKYRKDNDLTQLEFADKAEVSVRNVKNVESAKKVGMETTLSVLKAAEANLYISKN